MARPGETANAFQKEELPKSALSWYNIKRSTRLFKYLGGQRWKFILGLCFLTASAGVGLIFPLKSGELIGYIGEDHLAPETIKINCIKPALFYWVFYWHKPYFHLAEFIFLRR